MNRKIVSEMHEIMDETVRGTCTQMCSDEEIKFRESHKLLHILEMVSGTESHRIPRADKKKIVKMYTRSAAGLNVALPRNLRTIDALSQTVSYLLHDVVSSCRLPWHNIYDFVADRLLAVRQDMLVQRLPTLDYINLLQPIIRFYTYFAYRLCELPIAQFDPVLNNKQLQECLKKLLTLYDEYEYLFSQNLINYNCTDSRPFFEALYIIFNLGDASAILRGLSLRKQWRTDVVNISIEISLAIRNGNWYKACRLSRELPALLAAVITLHLPKIRRQALERMSTAYNSKNLTYPLNILKQQLLYDNETELINDCIFYNIKVVNDEIRFIKNNMVVKELVRPRHEKFVYEKLSNKNLSNLILKGNL